MRGTIRRVDTISDELEEPFCFYLVDLEGAQIREPMWFEYDEVEVVPSPLAALNENVSMKQSANSTGITEYDCDD